jgi:3-oxoacyl-[acyl-carrier protein] reductase
MSSAGRVAVVTGGARGIGKAIVDRLLEEGAEVIVGDKCFSSDKKELGSRQNYAELYLDIGDTDSVSHFASQVLGVYKGVDILINNAGIVDNALLTTLSPEKNDAVIDVNLRGLIRVTRAFVPSMIEQRSGSIVNASSVVASGNYGQTSYAATKAAIESLTVTWARELGKHGIRVNAVAPGYTDTPMTSPLPDKIKSRVTEKTPLGRFGTPDEIARAYLFLSSDHASFITGTVLHVDGGYRP